MTAYEAMRVCPACVDHKGRSLVRVTFTDPPGGVLPLPAVRARVDGAPMTANTRATVVAWLRRHPGAGPAAISAGTGVGQDLVKKALGRAVAAGEARRDGRGSYSASPRRGEARGEVEREAAQVARVPTEASAAEAWTCNCCGALITQPVDRCTWCGWAKGAVR